MIDLSFFYQNSLNLYSARVIGRVSPPQGSDTIIDFTDGEDFLALGAGLTLENLTITTGSNATLISAGDELLAILTGLQSNLITASDFATI